MCVDDDLSSNTNELLPNLINYVKQNNRVHPTDWYEIMGLENEQGIPLIDVSGFPKSLILSGTGCNNAEKRLRLIEQIRFAATHGYLDIVNWYLKSLPDDHWEYGSQNAPGYYDIMAKKYELDGQIAKEGLGLCLRLFEIENIELIPDYRHEKLPSGKTFFNQLEFGCFFDVLHTLFPVSAEILDTLIDSAQTGAKQLGYFNDWPSPSLKGNESDASSVLTKNKDEVFDEKRLIENEAMVIKFQLLRLYDRYNSSLRDFYLPECDIREFSEIIWDLHEETSSKD